MIARFSMAQWRWLPLVSAVMMGVGCEADLRLEGVDATRQQAIRRTDQFLALERAGDGSLLAFADNGIVLEAKAGGGALDWRRTHLENGKPNFIDSTTCPDGRVYGLSFENQLWYRTEGVWQSTDIATQEQLQAVACNAASDLWVAGAFATLLRSADGGNTWEDFSLYEDFTLTALAFPDEQHAFAVGEFGTLVKSVDGGNGWEVMPPIADDFYPLSVHFANAKEGWVSGVLGLVLYTDDGGETWSTQNVATEAALYGFVASGEQLFTYGDLGALFQYDPREGVWRDQPSPEIPVHYAGAVALDGKLLLVGGWGVVMEVPIASSLTAAISDTQANTEVSL